MKKQTPTFWDLLQSWLDEHYAKYGLFTLEISTDHTRVKGKHFTHKIKCAPCKAAIYLDWEDPHFTILVPGLLDFQPANPNFSFEQSLGGELNAHLWHHCKGPLYNTAFRPEGGSW